MSKILKRLIRKYLTLAKAALADSPDNLSYEGKHYAEIEVLINTLRKSGIEIGNNCYIWGVTMIPSDPITIGDDCVLTHCTILGHDAAPSLFIPELQRTTLLNRISRKQPTVIGNRCFIGVHSVVLSGVTIGSNSIVAAGAIVTKDVPEGSVVAGNPARVISTIDAFIAKHRKAMLDYPERYPGWKI